MVLDDFTDQYVLYDGSVRSVCLQYSAEPASIQVVLRVRRHQSKRRYKWCEATLLFTDVQEVHINDDDLLDSEYSDIVLCPTDDGGVYLSLDPYGNSGVPHPEDNDVIISKNVTINVEENAT